MTRIVASGGFCAPVGKYEFLDIGKDNIWHNRIQNLSPLRRWFSWDKGWGFPLQGGPLPRLRDLFPVVRVPRGGITFLTP